MAKGGKDNVLPEGGDIAGTGPVEKSAPVSKILSEADAIALLKSYTIPEGSTEIFVTEDCNVFWKENESYARNHALKQGLKIFTIQCQDLAK